MAPSEQYSIFFYQYRDAANFKAHGELLLRGRQPKDAEEVIRHQCDMGTDFVAEQVGVPPLYAELYEYSGGPTSNDVCFHEFDHIRPVAAEDIDANKTWGTLEDLLCRFRSVKRWDPRLSSHCGR